MISSQLIAEAARGRWDAARAWAWQDSHGWLVGCNFTPSTAVNQLEMWQADTFDPATIDRELGWLAALGMNTARVFLHDLLWKQDAAGFLARIDRFLDIAARHKIGIMFVFFDSCWNPDPVAGPQRAPTPGVHNSYWVKSPNIAVMRDPAAFDLLRDYVTGVVGHLRNDPRVLIWDIWNEPDNLGMGDLSNEEMTTTEKGNLLAPLITRAFQWARSANPTQPLTSGVWQGDWADSAALEPFHRLQISASDVISFHRYADLETTRVSVEQLKPYGRPLVCTEYIARSFGSTFEAILPYFKQEKIAAYNWGAVSGKTQTIYPWVFNHQNPAKEEPVPWHHDILRPDGSPYDPNETALIKSLLGR